ncbi:MAG: T9SS type A sorting domain-containing protein [Bacteroidota bacterium]
MMRRGFLVLAVFMPLSMMGQLTHKWLFSDIKSPSSISVGDIDLDGDNDVLISDEEIYWLEFEDYEAVGRHVVSGVDENQVILSDGDGDGDLDFFYNSQLEFGYFENLDGKGAFGVKTLIYTISHISVFNFGNFEDVDKDGDMDFFTDGISWFENLGDFAFKAEELVYKVDSKHTSTRELVFVDWDNDADKDILLNRGVGDRYNQVVLLENNGDFIFPNELVLIDSFPGDDRAFTFVSDLDNNGDLDVAVHLGPRNIGWFQNVAGEFSEFIQIANYYDFPSGFEVADLDNDGMLDVLWSGHGGVFWKKGGQGFSFDEEEPIQLIAGSGYKASKGLTLSDFDLDGDIDIFSYGHRFMSEVQPFSWFRNDFMLLSDNVYVQNTGPFVYPNPASFMLHVDGVVEYGQILDAKGHLVHSFFKSEVDISHLAPGHYLIRVLEGEVFRTFKFVKI